MYHVDPQKPSTMFVGPVQRTDKYHWKLEGGFLVRVHRKWRKAMFEPRGQREMPIAFEKLTGLRITRIEYEDGYIEILEDNWLTAANPTRSAPPLRARHPGAAPRWPGDSAGRSGQPCEPASAAQTILDRWMDGQLKGRQAGWKDH